jgi:hypothetical protein
MVLTGQTEKRTITKAICEKTGLKGHYRFVRNSRLGDLSYVPKPEGEKKTKTAKPTTPAIQDPLGDLSNVPRPAGDKKTKTTKRGRALQSNRGGPL